ncbi:MAG: hypothetical protein JXQ84_04705, partial [Rhodospirillaceae bacterium]|nr:hypothetical protein [Rhodospirillaceae bacterium]
MTKPSQNSQAEKYVEQKTPVLDSVVDVAALRALPEEKLPALANDVRAAMIDTVSTTGGHLG